MKTLKVLILTGLVVIFSFSCKQPVGLGARLDIEGPVVTITSPAPRKAVQAQFDLSGTVSDNKKISRLLVTASLNNEAFPKQWQYNNGSWEYSNDSGVKWLSLAGAKWEGTGSTASWTIPIDMFIQEQAPRDGEYTFTVQAWDAAGFSDDNSFKTIVLIFDHDPPKVDISNPYLYRGDAAYQEEPLSGLHIIADDAVDWKDPAKIGKFITQGFNLQWQIEDNFDVWSINLSFYKYDELIDEAPGTDLPDSYIYRYYQNLPPPPDVPQPQNVIKPNGSVMIPPLTSESGFYDDDGKLITVDNGKELKNPITEKTTIKVVAVCYDAAGNPNQEKILGYFIYWPRADQPWIVFTDGMKDPDNFYGEGNTVYGMKLTDIEEDVFMVYPGRSVKATAFQAEGVSKIVYSLYRCGEDGTGEEKTLSDTLTLVPERENVPVENPPIGEGTYTLVFPWEFYPPTSSGYYVVEVIPYDSIGKAGMKYKALFRVQDITFPDFPVPPSPSVSKPLFEFIENNEFTLQGEVSDATGIKSLALVWINSASRNYAAMSQLSYFRDENYGGWQEAVALTPGSSSLEYTKAGYEPFDSANPNRLWNLILTEKGENPETSRKHFSYSHKINLPNELNIGQGKQPLRSQVFLLRVENTTGKCTIITYAPQGDTLSPEIKIDKVEIPDQNLECTPGTYAMIDQFKDNNRIIISGTWKDDSTQYLNIVDYLIPYFKITVNGRELKDGSGGVEITFTPDSGNAVSGSWTVDATVKAGNTLEPANLKDTLVIGAEISDIGGNIMEAGASWLIQSDTIKLLRITSGSDDTIYNAGKKIEIILEFNKPVRLKNSNKVPALKLNSTNSSSTDAVAYYRSGQSGNDSRQYFDYTVGAEHSTLSNNLNVISLIDPGDWEDNDYLYTWITGTSEDSEEIRVTENNAHDGGKPVSKDYHAKRLPVTQNSSDLDYQFTLGAGKRIKIDTTAPRVKEGGITSSTLPGYYSSGDIYINVEFTKDVIVPGLSDEEITLPKLTVKLGDSVYSTLQENEHIKVVGNKITFVYSVDENVSLNEVQVQVTGISGGITDIAGTNLDTNSFTSTDLTGIYIDTKAPGIPIVKLLSENNIGKVLTNNISDSNVQGVSGVQRK